MVRSLFPTIHNEKRRYILNSHRIKKFGNNILLVTDQGSWVALSKKEYAILIRGEAKGVFLTNLESKGIILTQSNVDSVLELQRRRSAFLDFSTALHIIVPTLNCNHQCVYCHSSAKCDSNPDDKMSRETADKILDYIFQTPTKPIKIEFQGGETLLSYDMIKYIVERAIEKKKIHHKNIEFCLVTNLTLIDEEMIEWIANNDIKITTSLDGPKKIHDHNRKYANGQGSYDILNEKITLCRKQGINLGALMVTTKYSMTDPNGIVDEYVRQGFRTVQIKFLNKLGFAEKEWDQIGYTPEEYIKFWKKCLDRIVTHNANGNVIVEVLTYIVLNKILSDTEPGFLDFRSPCGAVIGQTAYDHEGNIYPCDEARAHEEFILGNVAKHNQKEIIQSSQAQSIIKASINDTLYCDTCIYKPYCGTCPVMNFSEEGNVIPKISKNYRCKIFKAIFDHIFTMMMTDKTYRKVFQNWVRPSGQK
jgi:uncharacterized protein